MYVITRARRLVAPLVAGAVAETAAALIALVYRNSADLADGFEEQRSRTLSAPWDGEGTGCEAGGAP